MQPEKCAALWIELCLDGIFRIDRAHPSTSQSMSITLKKNRTEQSRDHMGACEQAASVYVSIVWKANRRMVACLWERWGEIHGASLCVWKQPGCPPLPDSKQPLCQGWPCWDLFTLRVISDSTCPPQRALGSVLWIGPSQSVVLVRNVWISPSPQTNLFCFLTPYVMAEYNW